jgi:hypothetical protein
VSPAAAWRVAAAVTSLVLAAPRPAQPIEVGLDRASVAAAVRLGRSDQRSREQFHQSYRIAVDDPVVREVDVVTEFRRVVQMTEEREGLRDATWDADRAVAAARGFKGIVDLRVALQFSPANTYRSVPAYTLVVYKRTGRRAQAIAVDVRTTPTYVNDQPAPAGTPVLGATLRGRLDAARLDASAPCIVAVLLDGKEVRRVVVDLGQIR